ncbi:MAG TPA: prepilin-type N-terminal cleavage/methylation domain-containing protein [Terriglobales bacterium]|nr:prepilin-type N-terminal cleavage/methylation domain-containing protein [Terriglobales bacterium]
MRFTEHKARGFSLMELVVAMTLGLIVLAATAQLFKGGMDATILVTQSSEMQQSVRSTLNLIAKDVSMAGSGLPSGGLSLPYGAGAVPSFFAVDPTKAWLANNTYPTGVIGGSAVTNYMFGIIPGPGNGMELGGPANITATGAPSDAITVIYSDYAFPLNQYTASFPAANPNGDVVNFAPPAVPPAGFPAIQSATGIQVGDLILLQNTTGYAVGEVTGLAPGAAGSTNITFANGDPLKINQSGAAKGNIKYIIPGGNPVANRIWVITYFVEVPAAGTGQVPRLMRQVNGQTPSPVADNIINLSVTYDACDGTIVVGCSAIPNPLLAPYSPSQVHKVNIQVMGQTLNSYGNRSRSAVLTTSVSTRSLSFKDRYQ